MVDREKVVSVLVKRFPGASAHDVAAAANAIVGLGHEYEPMECAVVLAFECVADDARYDVDNLETGKVRLYRRLAEP